MISRPSFYYAPRGETEQHFALLRLIDEQFLDTPFHGVRRMTWHLRDERRVRSLMRLMKLMPIYQKPNIRKPAKGARAIHTSCAGYG